MKRNILNILLVALVFLFSCKSKEKIAPSLEDVLGPVEFENSFTASNTNPNFWNGEKVVFSAKFKNDAQWVITITGNISGAVKTFQGTSSFISATNALWDGTANTPPSFRSETVTATLSFPRASSVSGSSLSIPININTIRNSNYGHVLITDFSTTKFSGAGADSTLWASDFVATAAFNDIPLLNPDGNAYCVMGPYGTWQPNQDFLPHLSPYIDFLTIPAYAQYNKSYYPLIADPNNIYFNAMVYNQSLPTNTWIEVILNEQDPVNPSKINGKAVTIKPDWTGWKLVTKRYLDFRIGSDTTNTVVNPQKIKSVTMVLLSNAPQAVLDQGNTPSTEVSATFDHLIFTHYKPYQP